MKQARLNYSDGLVYLCFSYTIHFLTPDGRYENDDDVDCYFAWGKCMLNLFMVQVLLDYY